MDGVAVWGCVFGLMVAIGGAVGSAVGTTCHGGFCNDK
jgi:hypothetical protein